MSPADLLRELTAQVHTLAQAAKGEPPVSETLIRLLESGGSTAILGVIAWFAMARFLPKQFDAWRALAEKHAKEYREFSEGQQRQYEKLFEHFEHTIERLTTNCSKHTKLLALHDATVRGPNPETAGSTETVLAAAGIEMTPELRGQIDEARQRQRA